MGIEPIAERRNLLNPFTSDSWFPSIQADSGWQPVSYKTAPAKQVTASIATDDAEGTSRSIRPSQLLMLGDKMLVRLPER